MDTRIKDPEFIEGCGCCGRGREIVWKAREETVSFTYQGQRYVAPKDCRQVREIERILGITSPADTEEK